MDIVGNAAKFTPEGNHIKFSVSRQKTDDTHVTTLFQCEDTGIGISPEYIDKIFDSFSRDRAQNANGIKGTGLGMTISKLLANAMGGDITASAVAFSPAAAAKKRKKKEDVTLIIKVPALIMNSVSNPDILDALTFLQQAGEAFAAQYEEANVTIRVESFDYVDEIKAIPESFDTEDATDILYEGYFNMASYIYTGKVVPLDDIISDDLRDDIDDASWAMSSVNGKTYMMPFSGMQNILIYNKRHFESCGLEKYVSDKVEIQNWTLEEWTEILDTLAEKLPDQTYPMMMYGKNNQGDTHIMTLLRAYGGTIFDEAGNFDFESKETVQALEWIQEGVSKGWYPPHTENIEISDCNELFGNGQLSICLFNNAGFNLYTDYEDFGYVNFPGNLATSFPTGFEVFDNGNETKTKAAKDFIRYIYEK